MRKLPLFDDKTMINRENGNFKRESVTIRQKDMNVWCFFPFTLIEEDEEDMYIYI